MLPAVLPRDRLLYSKHHTVAPRVPLLTMPRAAGEEDWTERRPDESVTHRAAQGVTIPLTKGRSFYGASPMACSPKPSMLSAAL
jgi:hypothetical protein